MKITAFIGRIMKIMNNNLIIMNKYRVVYETINGKTKVVNVECQNLEGAEEKVYYNYPDCLQVLSIN